MKIGAWGENVGEKGGKFKKKKKRVIEKIKGKIKKGKVEGEEHGGNKRKKVILI